MQAVLNRYTRLERADGYVVWMHMDRWEGQDWRRSPGNGVSEVRRLHIDPADGGVHRLEVTEVLPPVEVPADTERVKRIKMRSELLSDFWGREVFIGATVLLPRDLRSPGRTRVAALRQCGVAAHHGRPRPRQRAGRDRHLRVGSLRTTIAGAAPTPVGACCPGRACEGTP